MSSLKDADDEDVFEIQDYTTASDWERFTAGVEEILHDWQLANPTSDSRSLPPTIDIKSTNVEWQEKSVLLSFSDYSFSVTHHFMTYDHDDNSNQRLTQESVREEKEQEMPNYMSDLLNRNNDFPGRAHCLVRWFGLTEFVTLSPALATQPLLSPSKMKVVLSSLAMAANNTACQVPLFLQVGDPCDKVFSGVGFGSDIRTDFEMAYIKTPPPQCTHLSGLLDVLKSKIGSTLASSPVMVSIRFTYLLSDWPYSMWSQQPPDLDATLTDVGFSELGRLPFGALSDPVSELQVSTTWPCVSEYSLIDSDVQSDLNPSSAPLWSARLGSSVAPPCLLSEYMGEFLNLSENTHSIVQILGHDFDPTIDDGANIVNALDRLTSSPIPSFSSITSRIQLKTKREEGPISQETLSLLLNFVFPDVQSLQEESAPYPTPSSFSLVPNWAPSLKGLPEQHPLQSLLKKMKSCNVDSFVWRLTIVLCHVNHSLGGLSSVAHFVYEVLLELRFLWDNAILIPGLSEGPPDMASCIVNQKLQMLNCCIQHKVAREENFNKGLPRETLEEEDEFYECEESVEREDDSSREYSTWDKPEGRLKRFGHVQLQNRKDFIYIPITQEAAPNTEDMLEEQTGELLRLGSDPSGSCQRAKLMSASLLSDMESFKAANPGALLEDFVRWYSPRDWVEEDVATEQGERTVRGRLSNRMLLPGNLWKEVWDSAKPVPARRQKRLFDDTREAEKVLQWFNTTSPGRLCRELLPVVMHASVCRVAEEPVLYTLAAVKEDALPRPLHDVTLAAQLELVAKRVARLSRQPPNIQQYSSIYCQIETIERCIAKAQSLRRKLLGHTNVSSASLKTLKSSVEESSSHEKPPSTADNTNEENISPLESLVSNLLQLPEVNLEGGSKGLQASVIKKLFLDGRNSAFSDDSPPEKRERTSFPNMDPSDPHSSRDYELGKPAGREYLLRAQAAFPADHSRVLPQRLYAVILKNSFRLAGAITQDTLFS